MRLGAVLEPLLIIAGAVLSVGPFAAFVRRERQNRLFPAAIVSLTPFGAWALASLLASAVPFRFPRPLLAAVLAAGVWWASAWVPSVAAIPQWRRFVLACGLSSGTIASLAWALAGAYTGRGLPLPLESAREVAALGVAALPLAAAEEIWLRGMVFGAIARWRGTGVALLISTMLSALVHAGHAPEVLVLAVVTAAIFGAVRAWSGSAAGSIVAHAGWEGFLRGVGFL